MKKKQFPGYRGSDPLRSYSYKDDGCQALYTVYITVYKGRNWCVRCPRHLYDSTASLGIMVDRSRGPQQHSGAPIASRSALGTIRTAPSRHSWNPRTNNTLENVKNSFFEISENSDLGISSRLRDQISASPPAGRGPDCPQSDAWGNGSTSVLLGPARTNYHDV